MIRYSTKEHLFVQLSLELLNKLYYSYRRKSSNISLASQIMYQKWMKMRPRLKALDTYESG